MLGIAVCSPQTESGLVSRKRAPDDAIGSVSVRLCPCAGVFLMVSGEVRRRASCVPWCAVSRDGTCRLCRVTSDPGSFHGIPFVFEGASDR